MDDLFALDEEWPREDLRLTKLICDTYLRCNGIAQGDRLSMATSVEVRSPLLDHKLVEAVIGLRKVQPDDQLPPKQWLRDAAARVLPDWVLRRRKRGFTPPVAQWEAMLKERHMDDVCDGLLIAAGVLAPGRVKQIMECPTPPHASTSLVFKVMVLESWCRQMAACAA